MKKKKIITPEPDFDSFQEWNPKEGFGIIPDGISLTQNLGCAGGKKPRENSKKKDKN